MNKMIIVTTPMCKKIVEFAGISDFKVNKFPDKEDGDLAILLSESKTKMNSLKIKLNTFSQIKESIISVSKYSNELIDDKKISDIFSSYELANEWINCGEIENKFVEDFKLSNSNKNVKVSVEDFKLSNSNINIKVYSNFLKDIVSDFNFNIVENSSDIYDYVVYPDYLKDSVLESEDEFNLIEIPTHSNVSDDPIIRAESRYKLLIENFI